MSRSHHSAGVSSADRHGLTPAAGGFTIWSMEKGTHKRNGNGDEKKVIYLELVAASSIFFIVALVLYMVFTYKPA